MSNIFQQPNKPMGTNENEMAKNDEISKTLATLLTLPTNKLEETMNNELNTQQSHINSEYFYLFYYCKGLVCLKIRIIDLFKNFKNIEIFFILIKITQLRMAVFLIFLLSSLL